MKGTMDNRLEALERNMESLKQVMEEREASANKSIEFMWKRMEDREEHMNQQMEEIRTMLTSFMTNRTHDREEAPNERGGDSGSGGHHNHQNVKGDQGVKQGSLKKRRNNG